jgi:hypothetical protein
MAQMFCVIEFFTHLFSPLYFLKVLSKYLMFWHSIATGFEWSERTPSNTKHPGDLFPQRLLAFLD